MPDIRYMTEISVHLRKLVLIRLLCLYRKNTLAHISRRSILNSPYVVARLKYIRCYEKYKEIAIFKLIHYRNAVILTGGNYLIVPDVDTFVRIAFLDRFDQAMK